MKRLSAFILLSLGWILAACNPPQSAAPVADFSHAWLDAPRNGSLIPWAPYEVVFHGSNSAGVLRGEFVVNGQVHSNPVSPQAGASLVTFRVEWMPPAPGEYTLQARTQNRNGTWSEYAEAHVMVAGADFTPIPEYTASPTITETTALTATSSVTPTPTFTETPTLTETPALTATPSPTETPTFTPTMISWLFSNSSSPAQVYQGNCGANQITFQVKVTPAENVKGMLVFTRWKDSSGSGETGWDTGTPMSALGDGLYTLRIGVSQLQGYGSFLYARIRYQFVATDSSGQVLSRSPTYDDISAAPCIQIPTIQLPPFQRSTHTPTATPQIVK